MSTAACLSSCLGLLAGQFLTRAAGGGLALLDGFGDAILGLVDALADLLAGSTNAAPLIDVEGQHGVQHQIWRVDDPSGIDTLSGALDSLDSLYIADGHHRSAAASRVARIPWSTIAISNNPTPTSFEIAEKTKVVASRNRSPVKNLVKDI